MAPENSLRLARPADVPAIAAMSRDRIETGLGWRWTAPRLLRVLADPETNVLVRHDGDRLVGFGIMQFGVEDAHLLLLAVRADATRTGIGSALLGWLERCAGVAGLGAVTLEARASSDEARSFYAFHGYGEIGTVAGYYQGVEACVRLAKRLRPATVSVALSRPSPRSP